MDLRYIIVQRNHSISHYHTAALSGGRQKKTLDSLSVCAIRMGVQNRLYHQQSRIIETNDRAPWSSANYRIHTAVTTVQC